jgi:hypothetical protein
VEQGEHDSVKSPTAFRVTGRIEIVGANPYVVVDAATATALRSGWRKPMPVLVKINGEPTPPWRTNMMPTGRGDFRLYLHGEMRKVSGTTVKDVVSLEISFDEEYRNGPLHEIPEWFQKALDKDDVVGSAWMNLTPSRQKEVLRYFARLQSDEAKERNLGQILRALRGEEVHYMGRDWTGGK